MKSCLNIRSISALSEDFGTIIGNAVFDEESSENISVNSRLITSAVILSPLSSTNTFSIKCFNSLTFPGHAYCFIKRTASGVNPRYLISFSRVNSSANLSMNALTSSTLSRRAGKRTITVFSLKYRSCLKSPFFTKSARLLFVAAITRTSVLRVFASPTRMNSPLSSTLSNLTCVSKGVSPISSKKMVPLFACSKYPFLSSPAPVNDPFL